jgi:hypothetical protein
VEKFFGRSVAFRRRLRLHTHLTCQHLFETMGGGRLEFVSNRRLLCPSGELGANGENGLNGSEVSQIKVSYNYAEGTNLVVDVISFCRKGVNCQCFVKIHRKWL